MTEIKPDIRRVRPHQIGWLKRSELCKPTYDVWESPDGKLYHSGKAEPAFEVPEIRAATIVI